MKNYKKIIIIDDEPLILDSIKNQLKNENYHITLLDDPIDGIEEIKNNKFDLIISDIKMKNMTGLELLEYVKEHFNNIPVIIISGYVDDNFIEKAKSLGCHDYLIKPIIKNTLITAINKALNIKKSNEI